MSRGQVTLFFGLVLAIVIALMLILTGVVFSHLKWKREVSIQLYVESVDAGGELASLLLSQTQKPFMQILAERFAEGRQESEIETVKEYAESIKPGYSLILLRESDIPGIQTIFESFGSQPSAEEMQVKLSPPLRGDFKVTSGFGEKRDSKVHTGVDFATPIGTPVYAVADGEVVRVGRGCQNVPLEFNCLEADEEEREAKGCNCNQRMGNFVVIQHKTLQGIFYSFYLHLSEVEVEVGDEVAGGFTEIGKTGNTGLTTGPHLHFELRTAAYLQEGTPIDPSPYLGLEGGGQVTGAKWTAEIPLPGARPEGFKGVVGLA